MTLTKDGGVKHMFNEDLIKLLLADGGKELKEVKGVKNGKSTKLTAK